MEEEKRYIIKDKKSGYYICTICHYWDHSVTQDINKAIEFKDSNTANAIANRLNSYYNQWHANSVDYHIFEKILLGEIVKEKEVL